MSWEGVFKLLEYFNLPMAYLEKVDRFTSLDSVASSIPGTVVHCTVPDSSNRTKHQQVPEPGVEMLACLPLCQKKNSSHYKYTRKSHRPSKGHILFLHS